MSYSDIAHDAHPFEKIGNQNQSSAKFTRSNRGGDSCTISKFRARKQSRCVYHNLNESSNILSDFEKPLDDTKLQYCLEVT